MKRVAGYVLLFFFLFCQICSSASAAPEPGDQAGALPSLQQGLARAGALLEADQAAEACDLLLALLPEYPDSAQLDLLLARSARAAGRLTHAYLAYSRLVAAFPDNTELRMEYIAVLTRMGNPEAAKEQMEEVRALEPSLLSARDIETVVKGMEDKRATLLFQGRIASGGIYDSNVNMAPSLRNIRLGSTPIELDSKSTKKDAFGFYLQGAVDVAWRADPESSWWLVGDVAGYQRWSVHSSYRRDMTFGRGAAGVRYMGDDLLVDLRGKAETVIENNFTAVNISGAELTAAYAARPHTHLMVRSGLEYREDISNRDRSGAYWWAGPYARQFFGEAAHSVMLGVKAYGADAQHRRYSHTGIEPNLTVFVQLPFDTQLVSSFAWHHEQYNGAATVFGGANRRDEQFRFSSFLIHKLTEHWRIECGWQYTDNDSNSDLHSYDQNLVMIGMAWEF